MLFPGTVLWMCMNCFELILLEAFQALFVCASLNSYRPGHKNQQFRLCSLVLLFLDPFLIHNTKLIKYNIALNSLSKFFDKNVIQILQSSTQTKVLYFSKCANVYEKFQATCVT